MRYHLWKNPIFPEIGLVESDDNDNPTDFSVHYQLWERTVRGQRKFLGLKKTSRIEVIMREQFLSSGIGSSADSRDIPIHDVQSGLEIAHAFAVRYYSQYLMERGPLIDTTQFSVNSEMTQEPAHLS